MSIYTITLKRELLSGNASAKCGQANRLGADKDRQNDIDIEQEREVSGRVYGYNRKALGEAEESTLGEEGAQLGGSSSFAINANRGSNDDSPALEASTANEFSLNDDWLDCLCGAKNKQIATTAKLEKKKEVVRKQPPDNIEQDSNDDSSNIGYGHSNECLKYRREQLLKRAKLLQEQANQIEHSVNVTLEVTANLKQPNRIVWYKNNKQVTSSERPVLFGRQRKTTRRRQPIASRTTSKTKRTTSQRSTSAAQGYSSTTTTVEEEEQLKVEEGEGFEFEGEGEDEEILVPKYKQESSEKGSKLTIHDIQDDDYDQYTCKLIDLVDGRQYNIHTQLKQEETQEGDDDTRSNSRRRAFNLSNNMDEVIEVKEGDLNIELGIQILPDTNEDEELMSEEEKDDFIRNTTITWFKDDVKLNEKDADICKLFQFTYDQNEGFHRLIVRKATKETEGVYTCLVENESGTSSCSTQLVVGPGNKPKLTSRLQDVTVYVGQSLEFRIKSTGLPPIDSCQWFKDDKLIIELANSTTTTSTTSSTNERISMSRDEELSSNGRAEDKVLIFKLCIDNLKLDDTGRYKCRIINEYGYDETDCFVKVLQEIIEEHEEIEETIEETMRLGGGKKSTREEEETLVVEEEEREEETRIKRQRQEEDVEMADGEGRAPRFRRKLSDLTITSSTTTEEETTELIVSTERDRWSDSEESLKIRWFVNDVEIRKESRSSEHEIDNFYDESRDEWRHRLMIKRRDSSNTTSSTNRYTCRASNKFGEAETSCQVTKSSAADARKPRFLRTLEDTETFVGETIVMKVALDDSDESCVADDVQFIRDGKIIYSSKRDGDSRDVSSSSSKSKVRVRSYQETIEVEEEETITTTRYTSRRQSRDANKRKRAKIYEVKVENVQVDQMGTWECQAKNSAGTSSCKADVEVFAEPKIVTDLPETVRVSPGKEIRLTVEASGSPIPVYSWFKDGIGIAEEEDRVFTQTKQTTTTTTTTSTTTTRRRSSVTSMRNEDGISISGETLIIKDARPEDAGVYTCKIENRLGQVKSRDSNLTVIGHGDDLNSAPKIIKDFSKDQIFQIDEGENVILKVLAEGHPKPRQYWFKDTEEILERVTRFEVESEGQEYKLKIKRSEESDSGKYKVVLRNESGETESRTVEVKVNKVTEEKESQRRPSAPSIMLDSQDKLVGLGSNISFDVQVGGHPKPFITWYKNGRRMTESGDGRVSFVEEETTTTVIEEEEDLSSGEKKQKTRKEISTIHKLVITNVRESDEAIYSLKAENEFGSTKSSLVSLTVDKRKEAIDELSETKKSSTNKSKNKEVAVEEETTTTVTTTTKTEEEDMVDDTESSSKRSRQTSTIRSDEDYEDDEGAAGGKRRTVKTTRTTRTTTTTTEEEEEEEEEAERRRRRAAEEQEEKEEDSSRKSKRRTVVEEDVEEEEEEEKEKVKRRTTRVEEKERKDEEEETRRKVTEMEVDEEEEIEEEEKRKRRTVKTRDSESETETETEITKRKDKQREQTKREKATLLEETTETTETSETTRVIRQAPRVVSAPKEVTAGLGSSPELEVEVESTTVEEEEQEETKVRWLKNDQPIPDRLLKDNHIEIIEQSTSQPGIKKHVLRINSLRSTDAGTYKLVAENPEGQAETAPIELHVDRSMRPGERPVIEPAEIEQPSGAKPLAPQVVSVPEEIVAGVGSSPVIEAEIRGEPKPETTWFKDGQPITEDMLRDGHLEIVEQPDTERPDVTKQALKINNLKPADVAAYHVKAENPAGEVESEPTNLRIDRSMASTDEPLVTKQEPMEILQEEPVSAKPKTPTAAAVVGKPQLLSEEKVIKAPLGSSPVIDVPTKGELNKIEWLKDGKPLKETPDKHIEFEALPDGTQRLHINEMRSTDEAVYTLKASNDSGLTESAPIKVQVDKRPTSQQQMAPQVLNVTEEVLSGPGSCPELEVVVKANPQAAVTWFKDGRPLSERQLSDGHLEALEQISPESPDVCKYVLKVDKLRGTDEATYHLVAKNPLGTTECKPISLKLDRSMRPSETPQVKKTVQDESATPQEISPVKDQIAPELISLPQEVVAGVGSTPVLEAQIKAAPKADVKWFKDGQPIPARLVRDGHIEFLEESTGVPGVTKHSLKINDVRPTDVAAYHLKAENPLGELESEPINLRIDRAMGPRDEPQVTPAKVEPVDTGALLPSDEARQPGVEAQLADEMAPRLLNTAQEVVAGLGSSPILEVEVSAKPDAAVSWLKDGQPIPARLLRDGHISLQEESGPTPGVTKHSIKINDLRPTDVAAYTLKAENPLGESESEPINLKIDRAMGPRDEPKKTPSEEALRRASTDELPQQQIAPRIESFPEEVVAGLGSSPVIEVEAIGRPVPDISWFKNGQPISERQLREGHLEIVNLPTSRADCVKQALKIHELKSLDAAAYHVKAENPVGEVESAPTNVRIDRSMAPDDRPIITGVESIPSQPEEEFTAPTIVSMPEEVVAGRGSAPVFEAAVSGVPKPEISWFKDGQPISESELRDGHLEIVEVPTDNPEITKQALKINDLKPADVAAYHVKAKNPAGEVESEPTNVRIDRSMGPRDEPVITGVVEPVDKKSADLLRSKPQDDAGFTAPRIVSMPEELVAGPGSSPMLVAEVAGTPKPELTWFKDGQPITERLLRDGHLEIVDLPTNNPDTTKQALKINSLKPADVAAYHVKAENPAGEVESVPTNVRIDRSMGPRDEPVVIKGIEQADKQPIDRQLKGRPDEDTDLVAPKIISMPEELVAGPGSSPMLVAEVAGTPKPELTWFKDGQPITERLLRDGHLEIVDLPTNNPDTTKQALKINSLKPADVAAYHVKAENPAGEVESVPTNVRIDRSMGPRDEPVVTEGVDSAGKQAAPGDLKRPSDEAGLVAPKIISMPEELVAGPGSSPMLVAEVAGTPKPELTWFKDGRPITERLLRDSHLEIVDLPTNNPDTTKQALKINSLKPADVAAYHVKAENPAGEVESEPTNVRIDRSMGPRDEPVVTEGVDSAGKQAAPGDLKRPSDEAGLVAPKIISMPEELVAGPGSSPMLVAEVAGTPKPELTWFKDGQPITERLLRDGHLEIVDLPTKNPDTTKQALKINNLKPVDAAAYHIKAENSAGEVESEPTNVRLDRSMGPRDEPVVTEGGSGPGEIANELAAQKLAPTARDQVAPTIVSMPEEVVAGAGSSPEIVAEVAGKPEPQLTWYKDGQPITEKMLRTGHLEIVAVPTSKPDTIKQALKINNLKPADMAAYHVKAENPAGEVESEPTNVRIDRSMAPTEEPKVTGLADQKQLPEELASSRQLLDDGDQVAPTIVSMPEEVVAGAGSSPEIVAEVTGKPQPQLTWFKDGQPITERQLCDGHLEIQDLPTAQSDTVKQALKINNLKPADAAAYHVKAENPLGEAESGPTNVRIDRSMGPREEPVVKKPVDEQEESVPMDTTIISDDAPQLKEEALGRKGTAPKIISVPKEIVAALGSNPALEVEIKANPQAKVNWFKDGQPIPARLLRDGHIELVEQSTPVSGVTKHSLIVNDLRPSDEATYHVQAENPLGEVESAPIKLRADRSMSKSDEPVVVKSDQPVGGMVAPQVVSMPDEIVAGAGSSPVIEAVVSGQPVPELSWFKDGQLISERMLSDGHLAIVDVPTSKPDTIKQALKINNLKPADVAAYHVKAENPAGEVESEPTNVRIDRSMGPKEEPKVSGGDEEAAAAQAPAEVESDTHKKGLEKPRLPQLVRNIKAPIGSSPVLDVEVTGGDKPDKVEWYKDGELVKETPDMHIEMEDSPDTGMHKLQINNMKPEDEGVYTLKATNAAGTAESGPIKLAVDRRRRSSVLKPEPIVEEFAPEIINQTEEIVAGLGSHPLLEVYVKAEPQAVVTWYKDGRPILERRMSVGHLGMVEEKLPNEPTVTKHTLRLDHMKAADAATYMAVAKNPLGTAESLPIKLKLDRALEPDEAPLVKLLVPMEEVADKLGDLAGVGGEFAPQVVSMTDEIVAGVGSSPAMVALIKANPQPKTTWFKDGQPISEAQLADGHLEIVREQLPDDTIRETLTINGLKPADVAAYHVMAENPLGEIESVPVNVRIDRSMEPQDEPLVTKTETPFSPEEAAASRSRRPAQAPCIRKIPRKVVAALHSNPVIEVEISGEPKPEVVWFKDGRQVAETRGHIALVELPGGIYKLSVTNLKAVDQGDYTITATNEAGEVQSAPISLVIDSAMSPSEKPHVIDSTEPIHEEIEESWVGRGFAPTIVRVSDKVVSNLGGHAMVEIEVKASPQASVSWFKDGSPIPTRLIDEGHIQVSEHTTDDQVTKYTLQIDSLKPSDAGSYHIEAENPLGSVRSPTVGVTLKKPDEDETADRRPSSVVEEKKRKPMRAPVIKRVPRQIVAAEGSSPVLEVEVSGEPIPEVVWFKNGKRIERSDAHFTIDELPEDGIYRLTVNNARTSDEATYTVKASNEAGSVESGPIELKVEAVEKPRDESIRESPTDDSTVGGYGPQVVSATDEVVAGVGSSPVMEVVIKASPKAEVIWFKDGQPITRIGQRDSNIEVSQVIVDSETTKYVLKIKNLKPDDVAAYHVRAENPLGVIESMPTNVRIDRSMDSDSAPLTTTTETPFEQPEEKPKRKMRAPVIKRVPRQIVAAVGSSPVIEIEVTGEPKPEIIWFKNGRRVTEVRNHISFQEGPDGVYRLCFTNLKATDQAEYTVTATNEAGTVESGPISLIVDKTMNKKDEPLVEEATWLPTDTKAATDGKPIEAPTIRGLDDQEALPGGTVKLEAEVLGHPKPQIKWLKDGDEVELNILNEVPDSNTHSLTLKNVNDLYDGIYSLEASNVAGVARKDAQVKIVEKLTERVVDEKVVDEFKPRVEEPKRKAPEDRELKEKPFIKKGLKFSQVNQGRSIKFEVQIDGKYDELIWMKDGEQINVMPLDDGVGDGADDFVMGNTEATPVPDDVDFEEDEEDTLITGDDLVSGKPKRRFPPKILMRPRNIVAGPGSRIAFEVRYTGEPIPEIVWFKNGERISSSLLADGKVTITEEESTVVDEETSTTTTCNVQRLVIEDVQAFDVGQYHLIAENPFGNERTIPVTLELDNDMVPSDDLANTKYVPADDELTSQQLAALKRGRAPRILSRPKSVHAPIGSRVAFEVQVSGEPTPIVNWFRDGRLITQTSDGHVMIEEYSNGCVRLVLSDITDSDVGQYHVVAENKLGSERTIPVTLTIDETGEATDFVEEFTEISTLSDQEIRRKRGGRPPRILLRPKSVQATPGSDVTLEVSVVGQTKNSPIHWYKNGTRITSTSDGHIRIEEISDGYQRLVISQVNESDSGDYTVSAENDFGVSMSDKVKMNVSSETVVEETTTTTTTTTESFYEQYVADGTSGKESPDDKKRRAPRFTVKPRNKKAPLGSKVEFEVCVKGTPKPDVIWYKNGRRIHTGQDGRVRVEEFSDGGSKLVIEDLEETDHGVYAAEAKNEWGSAKTEDVQLRVTQKREISERTEVSQRGTTKVTTKVKKTRSHYTFSEERHGYVTLTLNDAQMEHDGDYKLIVRNKWGEASTQAPLVVIPKVEPRQSTYTPSTFAYDDGSSEGGRDSRARRTPFDELEDYGHELDKSVGIFGSESRYQSGEDTYLLQLRDTEFPLRLRKYLRFGARQSPSLRSNLMDAHWGAGARVTIRERRKFREVMDEEIDDEKSGRDLRPTPMRIQKEVGTCGYAAAQLEHLRVEAAERVARKSAGEEPAPNVDMMPPFFREKIKDEVLEETNSGQQEAVFACLAAGEPQPDYTWFRNDILITPDVNRMQIITRPDGGSELHIRDPRLHDSACFKVVARNVHGNVTSRARLRVASRPSRPEPPEYVSVTNREVFLEWRPPRDFDAADILGYRLEMSQSSIGQQDSWTTLATDIGHEFYVVDDLTPGTSYSFRISARNKFGWSDSSYSTYVTTGRADDSARLQVPYEQRARQVVSDICDPHLLRRCEEAKRPGLNYQIEQNPVKLNGADGQESWSDAYALQSEVAKGRFSVISKAISKRAPSTGGSEEEDQANNQLVAVKAVLVDSMASAQTKNEFDILRSLQHEKVVRLHMAYKDDDMFVFVMERLSGIDVLTYLSSFTSYNEDTVSKIITQVMDAIEYLHFRGMCLLELLPDNVVMTNGRTTALKLVDFSSARFVPRSGARVPTNASQIIEYCPPEVIAGHEVSTASDVWCIGVLTYVLLSGFSPFKGETEEETRENVRLGRYKYDHVYGNCTPEVTRFLINVFKKHSSKRPTIEQLYENKWLLPNEFMVRKRQHATFKTDKIVAFAEEFHKFKTQQECPQRLLDLMSVR